MRAYIARALLGMGLLGLGLVAGSWAQDADLKEGKETPRYPSYTYEEEVPHSTLSIPGSSAGMFFERHRYGEGLLGRWRAEYLNYGWKDYENYRLNTTLHLRSYDAFGNFIADGYEVFTLDEYRTRVPETGSLMHKGRFYQNWLHHLIIADDVYGGWSTRLMVGNVIHATFTPLTLDMDNFNGLRFDAISSGVAQLSLVVSRISDPIKSLNLSGPGLFEARNDGVYLVGGHWETGLGQLFTFGATYVNLYRFDSLRGFRANSRKGVAPQNTVPYQLIVRFEDDSPEDQGGGAAVFDVVAQVRLAPPVDAPGEKEQVVEIRPSSVEPSPGAVDGRHREASGFFRDAGGLQEQVYIDYVFEVPAEAVEVKFVALVANDYKISMRQKHLYVTDPLRGSSEKRDKEFEFFIIRRAEGNVTDLSNKALIHFDYGVATGVEVMGLNSKLSIPGLEVRGEVNRSSNHYQYPTLLGRRSQFDDLAGYLTIAKEGPLFSAGAEVFSIGPKYTSYNPHPSDSQRRLGEVFYFNELRQSPYSNAGTGTNNPFYGLVDDNDNMLTNETPDNWLVVGNPVEIVPGTTTGIFPFFDLDQDGYQDTNRNRNEFADYDEPFLMYAADPIEFYYGDDFNNNALTDAWEDDALPNYPYYKDEQGLHLMAGFKPFQGLRLGLGRYGVEQLAASGRNRVLYGRLDFDRQYAAHWQVRWDHETKDVQDDIPNDYFFYSLREGIRDASGQASYSPSFFADRLEARDSFVNRGLLRVEYQPTKTWNLEGKFRYELNHQRARRFAEGGAQPEDDIDFYGAVFRTDYTYRRGGLSINPRLKVLYRFQDRQSQQDPIAKNLQFVPILRADCPLTERSQLRLGIQGFPGLVDRRRDFADETNDTQRTSWTLMWFNESEYEGYRIGTEVGMMRQQINFDEPRGQDVNFTRFFIRMITGVGTVVR